MVYVAVAGGTGHLGRTLVEGLVQSGQHEVFVLTRKATTVFENLPSVHVLIVSYDEKEALQRTLEQHRIEVVISAVGAPSRTFDATVTLIRACADAHSVKRFAPSDWLLDFERRAEYRHIRFGATMRETIAELRKHPNLEWTVFHNGYFMDYFGQPWAPTHMPSEVPFIDIAARQATIPGTGDEPVVWTHTTDVAKFVSRAISMELGTWKEHTWIIGDKVTFHQILAAAEKARGVKFNVTYDSLEKLRSGHVTPIPANRAHADLYSTPEFDAYPLVLNMFAGLGEVMASGGADIGVEESLNAVFPDAETVKVLEFIEQYWTGK